LDLHLHLLNKVTCNSQNQIKHIDVKSDRELKNVIREEFNINNPIMHAVSEKNFKNHLSTFEDLLSSDYHVFQISKSKRKMSSIVISYLTLLGYIFIIPLLLGLLLYKIIQ
jgi:hypothetical protein